MSQNNFDSSELYLFSLSQKLISSFELLQFDSSTSEEVKINPEREPQEGKTHSKLENKGACTVCKVKLPIEDWKYHYKTDFHRLNLKRNVQNLIPLSELEFDKLIEEESIESLSGSDSESEAEADESKLGTILEKFSLKEDEEDRFVSHLNTKSPFILLKSNLLNNNKAFGVYKSFFTHNQLLQRPMESIQSWTSSEVKSGKSALFMIGGGHFAGAIISHVPKNIKGNANRKESKDEQSVDILVSKTFHRYTTRRKQGGSQSASDNARGKANSAGSSIRRYNEQALIKEVRELILTWKESLRECSSIFIRANGAANRKILVGYEGSVLQNDDERIRSFPFTTKRATTSELKKAWIELSHLHIVDLPKSTEQKIRKQEERITEPKVIKPQTELTIDEKHSLELVNYLKKQKAPMFINYLKKNNLTPNFILSPQLKYANEPTLLHFASSHSLSHMIQVLLINLKADPTIKNKFGRTAYEVANTGTSKQSFRIARHKLGESYIDWSLTGIDSAKSKEEFDKDEKLEQERVKKEIKILMEEEYSRKTELEMKQPKFSSSGKLEFAVNRSAEMNNLSDEQKARIMREQRARAAEARLKKMSNL